MSATGEDKWAWKAGNLGSWNRIGKCSSEGLCFWWVWKGNWELVIPRKPTFLGFANGVIQRWHFQPCCEAVGMFRERQMECPSWKERRSFAAGSEFRGNLGLGPKIQERLHLGHSHGMQGRQSGILISGWNCAFPFLPISWGNWDYFIWNFLTWIGSRCYRSLPVFLSITGLWDWDDSLCFGSSHCWGWFLVELFVPSFFL